MTVLVYFSSENRSDESKQRSQHSASHSNTQSCFEWFSVLNKSFESKIQWPIHKHLSHSWWIGRLNESWMNDSMTRLIKPLITCICAHYRQTNQICSKLFFFFKSVQTHFNFIQELCIYKTITFYDSSLVIKKICKFFFFRFFFLPFPPTCP